MLIKEEWGFDRLMELWKESGGMKIDLRSEEITKEDPDAIFEFLRKWAKRDENARSIVRDGMKKLLKEGQNEIKSW